jgi:ATP-dependent helicase HrpA
VFRPHPKRRIVLATNVAETSLTVPGIRSVVDPGLARISRYSARTKVQRLPIEEISQASADQRAGRCGRVAPGVCLRLYSEDDYDGRPEYTEPEITRTNLASVILQMAALGLGDIDVFPFVEAPDRRNIADGIAVLEELGAVDPAAEGTKRWLTPVGRELARLPVDPRLARMVLAASEEGCLEEVLVIASALSVQDVRERPAEQREAARQLHDRFADERSDFLSILRLWAHLEHERRSRSGNQFRKMCRAEFLHHLRIREWQDVHQQLRRVARQLDLRVTSRPVVVDDVVPDAVHRALLTGFLSQVGTKKPDTSSPALKGGRRSKGRPSRPSYVGPRNTTFVLAPGSAAAKRAPKWVMAAELVETDQLRARTIAPIEPRWLETLGGHLLKWSYTGATWDGEQGAAFVVERASLQGLPVVAGRRILLDRVNPELARELFIQHALVDPGWPEQVSTAVERFIDTDVIRANEQVVQQAEDIEARARRRDVVAGMEARFDFFDRRVPADVTTVKRFNAWWRRTGAADPHAVALTLADLLPQHEDLDLGGFPDTWPHDRYRFDLHYEFDATSPIDGLTIDIPVEELAELDPAPFTWTVPGLRPAVVEALLRALPKQVRKEFIPIADTARHLAAVLDPSEADGRSIVDAVAEHLALRAGIDRELLALETASIPSHLRPTFRVIGGDGSMLAAGKELGRLQQRMDTRARRALGDVGHPLERSGLVDWPDLPDGELPTDVVREIGGHRITAYPALVDERRPAGTAVAQRGDAVSIRLLATPEEQRVESWFGTRRLLELGLTIDRRRVSDHLDNRDRLALAVGPYGSEEAWVDDVVTAALDEVLRSAGGPPRTAARFRALDAWAVRRLPELLAATATAGVRILRLAADVESLLTDDWPTVAQSSVAEIGQQLEQLVHPAGLVDATVDRLDHVARYLEAMLVRLERLRIDPRRDHQLAADVRRLAPQVAALPPASRALVRWQLEELRVSVFAQHLGTDGPISVKRLRRAIDRAVDA